MSRSGVGRVVALGCLVFACGLASLAVADDPKVDSELSFVADMETIYVIFDQEPTAEWLKPVFAAIDRQFQGESKKRTIVFQATLHPDRAPDLRLSGSPALSEEESSAIMKAADPAKSPRSRVVDGTFRIITRVNGGTNADAGSLVPPLLSPSQIRLSKFQPLSIPEKRAYMKTWARNEAIPLLREFAERREGRQAEAIRAFGKSLAAVPKDGPIDVAAFSEKSPDFWKAFLASPTSDPLVPMTLAALHTANGDIARATRVVDAFVPFDEQKFGSSYVLKDFQRMQRVYSKEIGERIKKGIAQHDRGKLDEALKIYGDVLKDEPKSAWALFEQFQTRNAGELAGEAERDKAAEEWTRVRKAILDADPLYESMAVASGAEEAYDLMLRKESSELFGDPKTRIPSSIRYADIARELGQPGFAALLYATVYKHAKPGSYGNRKLLEDMLYCFEPLGVTGLKAKVPGDHAAEFKRIDAERLKQKRESVAFRKFVDPNDPEAKTKPGKTLILDGFNKLDKIDPDAKAKKPDR